MTENVLLQKQLVTEYQRFATLQWPCVLQCLLYGLLLWLWLVSITI